MFERTRRQVEAIVRGEELLSLPRVDVVFGPMRTDTHILGEHGWELRMNQRTPLHVKMTRPYIAITPMDTRDFGFRWKLRARRPYSSVEEILDDISGVRAQKFSMSKYETKYVYVSGMTEKEKEELAGARFDSVALREELARARFDLNEARRRLAESEKFAQRLIDESDEVTPSIDAFVNQALEDHKKYLTQVQAELSEALASIRRYEDDPFSLLQRWNDERVAGMSFGRKQAEVQPPSNVIDLLERIQSRTSVEQDADSAARIDDVLKRLA